MLNAKFFVLNVIQSRDKGRQHKNHKFWVNIFPIMTRGLEIQAPGNKHMHC